MQSQITIWFDGCGHWDEEKPFIVEYEYLPAEPSVGYMTDDYEIESMLDSDNYDWYALLSNHCRDAVKKLAIAAIKDANEQHKIY